MEVFTRELIARLPAAAADLEWILYSSRPGRSVSADLTVLPMPRLWSQLRLPAELWRSRPDLVFVPGHVVPFLAPGTALAVVHDLAYERFPEAYTAAQLGYLRLTTRWAELRCARLITVSQSTRRDLAELHGVDPARVSVVHPGPGAMPPGPTVPDEAAGAQLEALGIRRPFALTVGRVEPRKNQLAALSACSKVPGLQLVVAGPVLDTAMAAALEASERCRLLGAVGPDELRLLYQTASALVFPSLYEGFGLPVLEAMGRGLPVVCGRVASLPEVAGEAAEYVDDPADAHTLGLALARVLEDGERRRRLIELGRERSALFSWEACTQGVEGVIRGVLQETLARSLPRSVGRSGPS